MELFTQDWSMSRKLRMPAISRLQKVHNVELALEVLKAKGVDLKDEHGCAIESRDVVDGHREKTLTVLWKIIFAFQVEVLLDEEQLKEEIGFLKRTWRTRQKLDALRANRDVAEKPKEKKPSFQHSSTKITLLMDWVNTVSVFYNTKAENFTVSFSDGQILCYLIHHYHPSHLPLGAVCQKTTQTVECGQQGRVGLNCSSSDSDNSFDVWPGLRTGTEASVDFTELLENEKKNFQLVNAAVSYLGGVPAMINPADMSNTIPNEKVVMCYLSFLCARLLDLRNETRAARIIQGAWRKYRLKAELKRYKKHFRAQQVMKDQRCVYVKILKSILTLQAAVRGRIEYKKFQRLKRSAVTIQAFYRGMVDRQKLLQQRVSVAKIQDFYKACVLGRNQREKYLKLKRSAILIQAAFRGHQARWHSKKLQAALKIQAWFRGNMARQEFIAKQKAIAIVRRCMQTRLHRNRFQKIQESVCIIQRRWRETLDARRVRHDFLKMRSSTVKIQSFWRGRSVMLNLQKAQKAACVIQSSYRGYVQRKAYQRMRTFCRGWLVRRPLKERAQARRRQRFSAAVYHNLCAMKIQRGLRAHWALKSAKRQLHYVIYIQRWIRAKLQKKRYLEKKVKIIKVQRAVRVWLSLRNTAATVIQHAIKKYLYKKREQRVQLGIIKAQALWRGHQSRKANDTAKVVAMRHRFRKVNREVKEEDRLCNKTTVAIDYLLQYKHFSYILAALKHLGAAIEVFPVWEVIIFAIQILLNLSKYYKTTEAVYAVENSVITLLDLLQIYREKAGDKVADKGGSIFTKTCFLLAILLQDEQRALPTYPSKVKARPRIAPDWS
ncbi:hypothetical protein SKAU_G00067700 [Synaphobranchus kaupii]|uniref:Calponin-homology (CH) domain-containing protein n=1 Tax=Synaphobranchus kaupii TaxID=118154 RepID=A0A9Q1G7Q5_SYNKA|nr:hypothetical protein SKAU_G00067700 [Synaphobranchus kaupii]